MQPHIPSLPQPPLAGTSLIPQDHLLNIPQGRGRLPVPSASQSGLTLQLEPACPLPTAQTATPWIPPSVAEPSKPALSLSYPLCLSGMLLGWGIVAQVFQRVWGGQGLGNSMASEASCQPEPTFISALSLSSPCPGLGSMGKLISDTQTPPAASPTEGTENRGVREKVLKINSWASPSPADRPSGALWVNVKFAVATAAGQGMEGDSEGGQSTALDTGGRAMGKQEPNTLLPPHPRDSIWEKIPFLDISDPSPRHLVFPSPSARGARNCPANSRKSFFHQESSERCPRQHGVTWPSPDALWPSPGPHPPRLTDASAVTTEGRMAGAWDRGRCPGRACTATVNNPLPCPGNQPGLQSPITETKSSPSRRTSGATDPP